jgi:hypothetical protein
MMRKSASISMLAAVLTLVPFARAAHVLKYGSHSRELIVVPDPYSSSDITPYIQQGVNILKAAKGGTLVLSAGTYLIGDKDIAIRIDSASGILIRGDGDATVLKQMQMPRTNARYFFYLRKSSGITFENLRFEGVRVTGVDGDGGTETAIQAVDSYRDLRIRSCSFKFFKTGAIRLRGFPTQSRITNCAFESVDNAVDNLNYFGAIEVESGKDILILDNHFSGQRHSAIFLRRCESITVSGNDAVFDATGYHPQCSGIYVLDGAQKCIFNGNQFSNPVHGLNLQSRASTGIPIEDNIIGRNIIQARYSGINLNYTAVCDIGTPFLAASRNSITNNSISGVPTGTDVDSVDHAIYPQWATLTLISGNSVRQSLQGVNFQQCTKENQVLDNQIESARTGIVFNGSGIVSKNFLRGYATGIVADYSTYSAITDNVFSGTATRLSVHPSRVYHKTLSNNCDVNGNCD